jgi:hypothetical protein
VNQNATREQIVELLGQGLSNTVIAKQLRCDRHRVGDIRRELALPNTKQQPLTLHEKWQANTRTIENNHLEWTGERQSTSGTPVLRYWPKSYSPAAIAFEIKHGRKPEGYAYAECGLKHCVAPDHVNDEADRSRAREQLRALAGGVARPERCRHGHDQAQHGRYELNGRAYCTECNRLRKRGEQLPTASTDPVRDRFQARTEPADGGHLRWTGTVTNQGVPIMSAGGRTRTARQVAFELRHGRPPVGLVTASCGLTWCMAPGHAEDRVTRTNRRAMAALLGEEATA